MSHFVFHKDSLSLKGLKDELTVDVSAEKGNVLSVDIYGPEKIHPTGHFAYWNYKVPPGKSMVSIGINLKRISFYSVIFFSNNRRMTYADHWMNPEFEVAGQLNIFITLWNGNTAIESRMFAVSLTDETRDMLRQVLCSVHRLDSNQLFIKHFCEDEIPPPKLLVIESTSRCNLKCPMCPRTINSSPSGEYGDLDESILANLESAIRKTTSVCLSWMGEPLLNKRLPSIVKKIKTVNPGVQVSMTSNGALLSEATAEDLIKCGADSINISIDAANPEIYSRIRVGADLESVRNNIMTLNSLKRRCRTEKPDTCIAYVAGTENIGEMPGIIKMAEELDVKHVSLAIMDDFTLTGAYEDRLDFSSEIKERGREAFAGAELAARQNNIDLIFEMPIQFFHFLGIKRAGCEIEDILLDNDLPDNEISRLGMQKGCQVPWQDAFIAHNGDVHPCCVSPRVLGNLKEQTFEEIWNGGQYRAFRRKLKSYRTNEECRRCKRAIWNKTDIVESARDWMEVGRTEIHGLGWGFMNTDHTGRQFRSISRKATFFLCNSGKPYLSLTLGNERRKTADASILLNNVKIGTVVVPYGWQTEYIDISRFTGTSYCPDPAIQEALLVLNDVQDDLLKVDIVPSPDYAALKISCAGLLDGNEVDEKTKKKLRSGKSSMSRLLVLVKQASFYTDRIKKKIFNK